jgi:hypothetical protein
MTELRPNYRPTRPPPSAAFLWPREPVNDHDAKPTFQARHARISGLSVMIVYRTRQRALRELDEEHLSFALFAEPHAPLGLRLTLLRGFCRCIHGCDIGPDRAHEPVTS